MRRFARSRWMLLVLMGLLATPDYSRAQSALEQAPPEYFSWLPLGRPRMEDGGFFVAGGFLYMQQNNPILSQSLAVRGFLDIDGSISGTPHKFVGSGTEALNANQVGGPGTFEPGIALYFGWRFSSGVSLELGWWHVANTRFSASATPIPPGLNVGAAGADSFLFSPVYNFSLLYAGNPKKVNAGNDGATFGIWNAASQMNISFIQRFDQFTLNMHVPYEQGQDYKMYGIIGGRTEIMWSRFQWKTTDVSVKGESNNEDSAIYSNTISNRWYGANIGCGGDWYIGDNFLGGFAVTGEIHGALGLDFVKERARYELADFSTAASRNRNDYTFSPLIQGDISFWWFPTQGLSLRLGWDVLAVFNTVTSNRPVDFNLSQVTPGYSRGGIFWMHGLQIGAGFVF